LQAARGYATRRRRVSIEYALIRDVNDQGWRADMPQSCKASGQYGAREPDPVEPEPGSGWTPPRSRCRTVRAAVQGSGVECTVRDTRGQESPRLPASWRRGLSPRAAGPDNFELLARFVYLESDLG